MIERIERLPIPAVATCLSALTMANVYGGLGFIWVRWFVMGCGSLLILTYITKILLYRKTCLKEYAQTIPSSLYGSFCMCVMILGSFYYEMGYGFGKWIWLVAVVIHAAHIVIFTLRNVVWNRNINTTLPSWFVTYNGIMVSCVTGGAMGVNPLLCIITVYGIIVYAILIPIIILRLLNVPVKPAVYHTMPVVLAPCSLCVVSVINSFKEPNAIVLYILYFCVLCSLLFIIIKLPDFFAFDFAPGFAGMTFPMAIGIVATNKMSGWLAAHGNEQASFVLKQLSGFQLFLTSMLVGYVLLNFFMLLVRTEKRYYS